MIRRAAIAAAAALCGFALWTYWRASVVEREALSDSRRAGTVAFQRSVVEPVTGFSALSSPAGYRDAAVWNGGLYVASANTLTRYSTEGAVEREWRAGFELPPAPLNALTAEEKLWIATEGEGVLVYDGQRFERILPAPDGARKIRAVLPLASGSVLLATDRMGVLRLDGEQLRPFGHGGSATALAGTEDDLWIGTRDAGLLHLRAGQKTKLGGEPVHSLAVANGRAYSGTATGLQVFAGGRLERELAKGAFIRSVFVRGEEIFAGTLHDGLLRIPGTARTEDSGEVRRVFGVGGDVYVVRPESIDVLRDGRPHRAIAAGGALLTHSNISALEAGPDGRLWIGYFDRGLDIADANRERITHFEDDTVFCVNQIARSADGLRVAVATANGLVLFDSGGTPRQTVTRKEGLAASHVTSVAANGAGWIAGTPAGITFLDASPRSFSAFHGLVNNHVYALASRDGELVAGTLGGVSVLRNERVQRAHTTANSGLKTNWTTALVPVNGEWWAGTYGGGVQRMDAAGAWRTFEGMPDDVVVNPNAMAVTPNAVYAGTLRHGLLIWNFTTRAWRVRSRGLPSANVTAILYHGSRLYVGTDNGLVMASESQFQQ